MAQQHHRLDYSEISVRDLEGNVLAVWSAGSGEAA